MINLLWAKVKCTAPCLDLALLYNKCIILSFTLYSHNGIFSAPKCFFGGGGVRFTCLYINICWFFLLLYVCEHVMCWGSPLYCEQCVFKCTAVGFMEALKPFVGLFHNGSILSFALVRGIDPESFVCNWIPMQVLSCNHLVPHHCWLEGHPGREITGECSNLWMCLHRLKIESKGTMATWQIRTIRT